MIYETTRKCIVGYGTSMRLLEKGERCKLQSFNLKADVAYLLRLDCPGDQAEIHVLRWSTSPFRAVG